MPRLTLAMVGAAALVVLALASPGRALAGSFPMDPFEPNDTTATASPIRADGTSFTQYYDYDQAGDYLSFPVKKDMLYHVTISAQGYGCWGYPVVYRADGTTVATLANLWGSMPQAQSTSVYFSAPEDETLYLGYWWMSANGPPAPLLPYTVTVTEHTYSVIEGTVREPNTGRPLAGARVRAWLDASFSAFTYWPYMQADYQEMLTGADGTYRFVFALPGTVSVRFEDPTGVLVGEWYGSAALPFSYSVVHPEMLMEQVAAEPGGHLTGVDGVLRKPAAVEVRTVRADTGEPLAGVRVQLSTFQEYDISGSIFFLPESDASGITRWTGLDPHIPYTVVRWNTPLPVTASELAGFRFVGLSRGWFTPSDGETSTVTATYELQPSDVSLEAPANVPRGAAVVATACVSWVGSPADSIIVELQSSADGTAWTTLSTGRTDHLGNARFQTDQTAEACLYRARVPGTHDVGEGFSAAATVALRTLVGSAFTCFRDTTITVLAPDLLDDARRAGCASGVATLSVGPSHGDLTLDPEGGFVYVPFRGFMGMDAFTYRLWDGASHSDEVTVTIDVADPSGGPVPVVTAIPATTRLSVTSNRSSVSRRRPITLSGMLSPAQAGGRHVVVYVKRPGSRTWRRLTTLHTTRASRWSYTCRPGIRGSYYFQVRFSGDAARRSCTSKTVKVRVR